ncbi:hypothetical protein SLEP1_g21369 [Rubroshorea leprosula]|uniref:TF-B3 domain-containing protein n=1 Tax=Rubroshorea leprosula TaxID=152421 RepID=A0AAV5JB40_9ROSI|nr:hypothetical protein SLEP1_g21369 [Rubroshorea leprosula]
MGERVKVLSQILSNASLQKLTLGQGVLRSKLHLLPQHLETERSADLTLLNDVNGETLSIVTASIQSERAPRLVLLQKGWKPVVKKLRLKRGDRISIFLLDRETWSYSIQVERAAAGVEADQVDADMDEEVIIAAEALMSMATSGGQRLAHCDRETRSYSIQVEKAAAGVKADQVDADMDAEVIIAAQVLMSMATSGGQRLAHCESIFSTVSRDTADFLESESRLEEERPAADRSVLLRCRNSYSNQFSSTSSQTTVRLPLPASNGSALPHNNSQTLLKDVPVVVVVRGLVPHSSPRSSNSGVPIYSQRSHLDGREQRAQPSSSSSPLLLLYSNSVHAGILHRSVYPRTHSGLYRSTEVRGQIQKYFAVLLQLQFPIYHRIIMPFGSIGFPLSTPPLLVLSAGRVIIGLLAASEIFGSLVFHILPLNHHNL